MAFEQVNRSCNGRVLLWIVGGQGRNRTADASLFRAALYQLSYLAGGTTSVPDAPVRSKSSFMAQLYGLKMGGFAFQPPIRPRRRRKSTGITC